MRARHEAEVQHTDRQFNAELAELARRYTGLVRQRSLCEEGLETLQETEARVEAVMARLRTERQAMADRHEAIIRQLWDRQATEIASIGIRHEDTSPESGNGADITTHSR
ncbi:hypothetical protein N0V93_009994 [Gnomoniopsis smithogilvyi]|uniref:Uncharacterized protein n=1 Tax=Gnomoniopsis smithogilvyi TaxID=1191159 RepID=A0A9W8YLH0_9PEZI|nr:hypothetical protein N0V93_009994 [Gnomoniopsis smithogilvyi]